MTALLIQPTSAQQRRSETQKNSVFLVQYCMSKFFKKNHPSGNLKSNNLGIFQSLKLCNLMTKIHRISFEP